MYELLDYRPLIAIYIFLGSTVLAAKLIGRKIKSYGLINLLPPKLRYLVTNRSIYDILCDIFFM